VRELKQDMEFVSSIEGCAQKKQGGTVSALGVDIPSDRGGI
jgi:hypothetical protein